MAENYEMVLRHGYNWREKVADEVLAAWNAMPAHKRKYWTLRGKAPGDRAAIIARLG